MLSIVFGPGWMKDETSRFPAGQRTTEKPCHPVFRNTTLQYAVTESAFRINVQS
jgi:hypothetical protein